MVVYFAGHGVLSDKAGGRGAQSGAHAAGKMTDAQLKEMECSACPGAGSCGGQFTANTMACVAEAIGLALPGSSAPPAEDLARDRYAEACGEMVLKLLKMNIRPRNIVTKKALENAENMLKNARETKDRHHAASLLRRSLIDMKLLRKRRRS
jgi:dihydroxyacid dehydratase/phosphogluconate dehydratase